MSHEVITHVPVTKEINDFDGDIAVHRGLGQVALSPEVMPIPEIPGGFVGSGERKPGEVAIEAPANSIIPVDSTDRILAIEDQSEVTINPSKAFGHPAQLQRLEDQTNEIRSNLR
jgi:hypothetical protein